MASRLDNKEIQERGWLDKGGAVLRSFSEEKAEARKAALELRARPGSRNSTHRHGVQGCWGARG